MKAKKLIREKIKEKLKEGEFENITDKTELNNLYALKIQEELAEIQNSEHNDIDEFADLCSVVLAFAYQNGFSVDQVFTAMSEKAAKSGMYSDLALTNLNPNNPSNTIYFDKDESFSKIEEIEEVIEELEYCVITLNNPLPDSFHVKALRSLLPEKIERIKEIIKS